jgi:hypothetical protein
MLCFLQNDKRDWFATGCVSAATIGVGCPWFSVWINYHKPRKFIREFCEFLKGK